MSRGEAIAERDQDGESRGHEADEREERGEAGVPGGRDRTCGLGDLLIDLEQVSVGCVGRSLGRSLDRCERHAWKCRVPADAAKSPERTRDARHPDGDRASRAIVMR